MLCVRIQLTVAGQDYERAAERAHSHPPAVHRALGTATERELRAYRRELSVRHWYAADALHLGANCCVFQLWRNDSNSAPMYLPAEQRGLWRSGCTAWTFPLELGSGRGSFAVWPDGRAAVSWGDGESFWGSWDGTQLELDEGGVVDPEGWPQDEILEMASLADLQGLRRRARGRRRERARSYLFSAPGRR